MTSGGGGGRFVVSASERAHGPTITSNGFFRGLDPRKGLNAIVRRVLEVSSECRFDFKSYQLPNKVRWVVGLEEQGGLSSNFREATASAENGRTTGLECVEDGNPEPFVHGWENEGERICVKRGKLFRLKEAGIASG